MRQIKFELLDDDTGSGPPLKGVIQIDGGSIMIHFNGYGDSSSPKGEGFPLAILWNNRELKAYLWPNIKEENATIISLEGAREEPFSESSDEDE